jgi:two-component system chemotaxis response regulator CheB
MSRHDIVVIGASAGGVDTLMQLVRGLPDKLDAALFVVLHLPAASPSMLPQILSRQDSLPARHPAQDEPIRPGVIYVGPPNYHLIVQQDRIVLSLGPKENGHRPSIDTLFRSAALAYGPRVIGIVLSGSQSDGAAGLRTISTLGGTTMVQDPDEALYSSMPRHAIEIGGVDHVLKVAEIARMLPKLVGAVGTSLPPASDPIAAREVETAADLSLSTPDNEHPGVPSVYACPDCHGTLWEIREGDVFRFRCRVGHAWNADDLLIRQQNSVEDAMWSAVRALEEKASLAHRMAGRMESRGGGVQERFEDQAREASWQADLIRRALEGNGVAARSVDETVSTEGHHAKSAR